MNEAIVIEAAEEATTVEVNARDASVTLRTVDVTELDMIGGGSGIYLF